MNWKKAVLSIVVVCSLAPNIVEAYPMCLKRLVLLQDGKIVRSIDLISDIHVPEIPNQPNELGPAEQAMLLALRKKGSSIAGEKIELIGETQDEGMEYYWAPGILCSLRRLLWLPKEVSTGMTGILGSLHQEFYPSKYNDKRVIYTSGDCCRPQLFENEKCINFDESFRMIEQDLIDLQKTDPRSHAIIQKLWSECELKVLSNTPSYASFPWYSYIKAATVATDIMNFEVLIKIMKSQQKHNVIFVGACHCDRLSKLLVQYFDFMLVKEVGANFPEPDESSAIGAMFPTKTQAFHEFMIKRCPPVPADTWKKLFAPSIKEVCSEQLKQRKKLDCVDFEEIKTKKSFD